MEMDSIVRIYYVMPSEYLTLTLNDEFSQTGNSINDELILVYPIAGNFV